MKDGISNQMFDQTLLWRISALNDESDGDLEDLTDSVQLINLASFCFDREIARDF